MTKYMYCEKCRQVRRGLELKKDVELTCSECGETLRIKKMSPRICAECDSRLYAPDHLIDALVFPCKADHVKAALARHAEPRQEAAAQPEPAAPQESAPAVQPEPAPVQSAVQPESQPRLKCKMCQATLALVDGEYQPCPVCGWQPDETWVRRQQYFAKEEQHAVVISHEFTPDEMVYVHPISQLIPAGSLIVVNENQRAVYRAAGKYDYLEPNAYPVSMENRSEEEILLAIAHGETGGLFLRLNTKIIFFDSRWKSRTLRPWVRIGSSGWRFAPEVSFEMQIVDASKLMELAVDMADDDGLSGHLNRFVYNAVEDALADAVDAAFADADAAVGMDQIALNAAMRRRLDDEAVEDMTRRINQKLLRRGVAMRYLTVDARRAEYVNAQTEA